MSAMMLLWAFTFSSLPIEDNGILQLELENIESFSGSIRIAIYDNADAFENEGTVVWSQVVSNLKEERVTLQVTELPFGHYAIALYHDVNDNDQLDKNNFGIPTEPYAFSNNPKVKWKPPSYKDSKFHFSRNNQELSMTLKKWSKQ
ncbi:MAG: hypothetical protein Sapg2KO_22230 [Saprospiraceae bacterium]